MNTTHQHMTIFELASKALAQAQVAREKATAAYVVAPTVKNSVALVRAETTYQQTKSDYDQVRMMVKHMHGKQA